MDSEELKRIVLKIEKENEIFEDKGVLATPSGSVPQHIVGREAEAERLVRFLYGFKKGHAIPLVSIYGRSGSGKSTIVRYVCEELPDISMCYVNLRKAKTVFGAAKMIVSELGGDELKSAHGMNAAIERIGQQVLQRESAGLFVLVLDEFDVLFYDSRGKPSDFVYKLVEMQSSLKAKRVQMTIVTISNNVISDYELDDRVKSRIGSSEIFFEPYSKDDVFEILNSVSQQAFSKKPHDSILRHCARISSEEHGDARRAVDLIRVAAEMAGSEGRTEITKKDIDKSSKELQTDRIEKFIESASSQLQYTILSLAIHTFLDEVDWHSTADLYETFKYLVSFKRVSYRRFFDYLTELENAGVVNSYTGSKGRHGYHKKFALVAQADLVGRIILGSEKWERPLLHKKDNVIQKGCQVDRLVKYYNANLTQNERLFKGFKFTELKRQV